MKWKECKNLICCDLKRLENHSWGRVAYFFTNASFKITLTFRLGSYLKTKKGMFFRFLYLLVFMLHKHYQYLTGIQLSIGTRVGKGLAFSHFSCIVINSNCTIGDYCTIFQVVTIGSVRGPKGGVPHIGNNVVLASGAKIIGNVKIGNNVMVGAGAVVVDDIPDNAVVAGVPAKVLSYNGEFNTKLYLQ